MVRVIALAGIALFYAGLVSASPMPDSAIGNEVGVSAPDGIPLSNTMERWVSVIRRTPTFIDSIYHQQRSQFY